MLARDVSIFATLPNLLSMNPTRTPPQGTHREARAHVYDRLAGRYDAALKPCERLFLARWREQALANLGALPDGVRLLELGAGTGANFVYYNSETCGVAGEISRRMIDKARVKRRPDGVHLVQHAAEDLPFADDSFDCALATLVFCSIESPERAFAELQRVVRRGGCISLLEHVRPEGAILGRAFDLLNKVTVPLFEDHFNRRTAEIATRSGLRVERIERRAWGAVQFITCEVR